MVNGSEMIKLNEREIKFIGVCWVAMDFGSKVRKEDWGMGLALR